ncbi:Lyso-phosphatidylcholine acyltransferase [Coemansia erecta]|uniref:Tafazzin family protein n=1 Tax=Coemansia erecta TaxID=147472 RepID=A0A9W8CQ48_9FUNG|nr:Lyso-phosphatidylcholine acyltransferase [Coemansia erecta]
MVSSAIDDQQLSERKRPDALELIAQLPKGSWHERSFAFWARRQLEPQSARWWEPLSTIVVGAATTAMSAFLKLGFNKVVVDDLHKLTDIVENPLRNQPVITITNHESTMDDPVMWGVLPLRMRWQPKMVRWTLGAQELLYRNPAANAFFALGQTIPTVRGDGIYQLAVEIALRRLADNRWLHVFPEGRVNQGTEMLRFKWGVGRMVMESERVPIVIPMFIRGMREVLPLRQKVPLPRPSPFTSVFYMRVGDPIDFTPELREWKRSRALLTTIEEKEALDEAVRIAIVDRMWISLDTLKTSSSDSVIAAGLNP